MVSSWKENSLERRNFRQSRGEFPKVDTRKDKPSKKSKPFKVIGKYVGPNDWLFQRTGEERCFGRYATLKAAEAALKCFKERDHWWSQRTWRIENEDDKRAP